MKRITTLVVLTCALLGCAASTEAGPGQARLPVSEPLQTCDAPTTPVAVLHPSGICLNAPHYYWDGAGCAYTGPERCVNDLYPQPVTAYESAAECEVAHAHCR